MEIRFTKTAYRDAQHLSEYLKNESSVAVARTVLARIYDAITSLTKFPEQGRKGRILGTRELSIVQLPFIVAYRVERNELQILAIMHAARRWPMNFSD